MYLNNDSTRKTFVPIESIFDLYTDDQLWYYIPGFNGYEISNKRYVRSMKHYKKYPFGIFLAGKVLKNGSRIYQISDNNNNTVTISNDELWELAKGYMGKNSSYPRRTVVTDIDSRNKRPFIKRKPIKKENQEFFYPKFSVIKDDN